MRAKSKPIKNDPMSRAGETLSFFLQNPKSFALPYASSNIFLNLLGYWESDQQCIEFKTVLLTPDTRQQITALVYLLTYLDIKGPSSLGQNNQQTVTTVLKNFKMPTASQPGLAKIAQNSSQIYHFDHGQVQSAFTTLKHDLEKKRLGKIGFWFKEKVAWLLVILYALGCAVTVVSALCIKFLALILAHLNPAKAFYSGNYLALLLPSIGTISLATFWTNVKVMKSDVDDFIDQIVEKCKGHTVKLAQTTKQNNETGSTRPWYIKALILLVSLCSGLVLGLITWHFTHTMLMVAQPALSIVLVVVNVLTEAMLTYGLIENYWMPFSKGFTHAFNAKESKWHVIAKKFNEKSPAQKVIFCLLMVLFTAMIIYGLYVLCIIGVGAMSGIAFLQAVPHMVGLAMIAIAVVAQFPLYAMPCTHLSDYLSKATLSGVIQSVCSFGPTCLKALKSIAAGIGQNKVQFAGCWLLGTGGCVAALASTVGWSLFIGAPYVAVPVCIGAGLLYGMWNFANFCKNTPPNIVRAGTNALGNGAIPKGWLGMVCDFFNSLFCGLYGEKEALEETEELATTAKDNTQSVLALYSSYHAVTSRTPTDAGHSDGYGAADTRTLTSCAVVAAC
jgi:hypothetical protein